jgi:uncharacterized membrane protein
MDNLFRMILALASITVVALSACTKTPDYKQAPWDGVQVAIGIENLKEKTPEFYSLDLDGRRINFFLVRIGGDVQSYFDACATCYREKMGYRVRGQEVVCRACNLSFKLEDLKKGEGSCHPIPLKNRVEKGFCIITGDELKKGLNFF